jgi:hypothetical protein
VSITGRVCLCQWHVEVDKGDKLLIVLAGLPPQFWAQIVCGRVAVQLKSIMVNERPPLWRS